LISYAYTWEMKHIEPDIVVEVFMATDQYMIEGLRHGCEEFLCTCIGKQTVLELFHLADSLKSLFLREECFDYIISHYKLLSESEAWKEQPEDLRQEIEQFVEKRSQRLARKTHTDKNFSLL